MGPLRLWIRGRASVLLLEGRWVDSPILHVKVSLGKILNPELLNVLVGTLHGSHQHQCVNACMNYCKHVLNVNEETESGVQI